MVSGTIHSSRELAQLRALFFDDSFGRKSLPHRCTLSRYLSVLDQPTAEALRSLFLDDGVMRTAQTFPPGGLWDRQGHHWLVVDVDGTKQAARHRALPRFPTFLLPIRALTKSVLPAILPGNGEK